jgi:predicted ArsR family transcriptional regulator
MTDRDSDGVSAQGTPSRSGGRPEYKPTDEQRALVRRLRSEGRPIGEVAKAVGISRNTLRKHFADEVAVAPVEQQLQLGGAHHATAMVVEEPGKPGRPEFEPTQRQRDDVKLWASDDWTEDRMASQLGISRHTLRKHFAEEIQYGADRIRTMVLRDLQRSSAAGRTGASAKLLELTEKVRPPGPPKPDVEDDSPEAPLGKKAQAKVDAMTANKTPGWSGLVN